MRLSTLINTHQFLHKCRAAVAHVCKNNFTDAHKYALQSLSKLPFKNVKILNKSKENFSEAFKSFLTVYVKSVPPHYIVLNNLYRLFSFKNVKINMSQVKRRKSVKSIKQYSLRISIRN